MEESEPIASGMSKSKKGKVKGKSRIKSMFPDMNSVQREKNDEQESSKSAVKGSEHKEETISELLYDSSNIDRTSISSGHSGRQHDATSLSSTDKFFSLPASQSETSSLNDIVPAAELTSNGVHILEEELEERDKKEKDDDTNPFYENDLTDGCTNDLKSDPTKEVPVVPSCSDAQEQSPKRR